jgi:hypothetical protein
MNQAVEKIEGLWKELQAQNPELGDELFSGLILKKQPGESSYVLSWIPSGHSWGQPKKIADLKNIKWGFTEALKWEAIEAAVDQIAGLITVPIAGAIVDTALDRFFHFHKLVRRTHENMVLEFLADIQGDGGVFPANSLSADEARRAIESLSFAQSSLTSGWKWLWKRPYEEWQKNVAKEEERRKQGVQWLEEKGFQIETLNPRFAKSRDNTGAEQLRVLSLDKPHKKNGPWTAVNPAQPEKIFRQRLGLEILSTGVVFGTKLIPVIGGPLRTIYKKLVLEPVKKARVAEAQMTAHLEQRQAQGTDWSSELVQLDHQRVNPLFLSREKTFELIRTRKEKLGIGN